MFYSIFLKYLLPLTPRSSMTQTRKQTRHSHDFQQTETAEVESSRHCKHNAHPLNMTRRGGRAVECTGLENQQGLIALRGFKSHPLRQINKRPLYGAFFLFRRARYGLLNPVQHERRRSRNRGHAAKGGGSIPPLRTTHPQANQSHPQRTTHPPPNQSHPPTNCAILLLPSFRSPPCLPSS